MSSRCTPLGVKIILVKVVDTVMPPFVWQLATEWGMKSWARSIEGRTSIWGLQWTIPPNDLCLTLGQVVVSQQLPMRGLRFSFPQREGLTFTLIPAFFPVVQRPNVWKLCRRSKLFRRNSNENELEKPRTNQGRLVQRSKLQRSWTALQTWSANVHSHTYDHNRSISFRAIFAASIGPRRTSFAVAA